MMDYLDTRFCKLLTTRLDEERKERTLNIVNGGVASYEEYKERVGFINGLKFVREDLCAKIEALMRKDGA